MQYFYNWIYCTDRALANHKHYVKCKTRIICQTNCVEKCCYRVKKKEDWNIKKKINTSSTPKANYLKKVILYVVNSLSLLFYNVSTAWAILHIHDKKQSQGWAEHKFLCFLPHISQVLSLRTWSYINPLLGIAGLV